MESNQPFVENEKVKVVESSENSTNDGSTQKPQSDAESQEKINNFENISSTKATENVQTGSSAESKESKEETVQYFKTKKVRLGPIEYTIVTQNANGPCPLLALVNVLVLKGKIQIEENSPSVRHDYIMNLIMDVLLTPPLDEKAKVVYESNLQDVIPMISGLLKGLDVNVKFSNVSDFEFTPALSLFDLLRVNLYHVWLPDPQFEVIRDLVQNISYNELVVRICDENCQDREILSTFYNETQSQITFHGLSTLIQHMKDSELAVLFRNNHFHTILKRRDEIFTLVTDEGFTAEPKIVWESLSSVDGDSFFVGSDFSTFRSETAGDAPAPPQIEKDPPSASNSARNSQDSHHPRERRQRRDNSECRIL